MTCTWQTKLDAYIDRELPASELAELDAHLRGCVSCAAEALGRLQLKRATQAAGRRYEPRPEFRLKIERMAAREARPFWGWQLHWMRGAVVLAAVVLAAALLGFWSLRHSEREQALAELADLHVATLASPNPVDVVSSDRHTVKPWFQGKVPFTFNLPELQNSPYKLVGGRVSYFQQNPGAHLLFDLRQHHLSVFVFQDRGELGRLAAGYSTASKQGFNIATWTAGGLRYFVITDANPDEAQGLTELLKNAAHS